VFVKNDLSTTIVNDQHESAENNNNVSTETAKVAQNYMDGDVGIDNNNEDENSEKDAADCDTNEISSENGSSIYHDDDTPLENIETDKSPINTNNQIRRAIANTSTSINNTFCHSEDLSHPSHLSQPTKEKIVEFFHDDGLRYHPPPPHTLDEVPPPCRSIIRIDKDAFYYCILHPDF